MPRSEFDQKTILLRRVARVIAGGRRFSFSAAIVIGDHKGRVGVGIGKGGDTALAMEKAMRDAKKNMVRVKTTDSMSIPHDVMAKESSGIVSIRPAPERGIVAGSSVKLVLELAGVKDVTAKILSPSKNKLNIARATVKALASIK
jgi:small subunit ribosomal protein S5